MYGSPKFYVVFKFTFKRERRVHYIAEYTVHKSSTWYSNSRSSGNEEIHYSRMYGKPKFYVIFKLTFKRERGDSLYSRMYGTPKFYVVFKLTLIHVITGTC